ncbi:hypothetical protein D3C75_854490 [compost metagenome]
MNCADIRASRSRLSATRNLVDKEPSPNAITLMRRKLVIENHRRRLNCSVGAIESAVLRWKRLCSTSIAGIGSTPGHAVKFQQLQPLNQALQSQHSLCQRSIAADAQEVCKAARGVVRLGTHSPGKHQAPGGFHSPYMGGISPGCGRHGRCRRAARGA